MTEGFTSGLARYWATEGSPTVSEDADKFKLAGDLGRIERHAEDFPILLEFIKYAEGLQPAKPSQRVSGTKGDKILQTPVAVYGLSGSSYNRLGYAIHVESGSVQVGQKNSTPVTYRAKTTASLKDTWVYYDAVIPSSPHPLEFTCAEPDTVFTFRDVFIVPVSDNVYIEESYKVAGKVVGQDFSTLAVNKANPSVLAGNHFKTANTDATALSGFTDGQEGQEITVIFGDGNTKVDFTKTNLKGNNGDVWTAKSGDHMRCVYDGMNWYCTVSRNTP
jgi:hypothetical protein